MEHSACTFIITFGSVEPLPVFMITSTLSVSKNYLYAAFIAIIILIIGLFLLHAAAPVKRDLVATGFLVDIVVTFPVVFYFLVIRPLRIKKWKMVLVFTCCCGVAYCILPAHQQYYIIQLRKLTVGLELGVLIYALSKIKKIRSVYYQLQADFPDTAYNLQKSMMQILGGGVAVKVLASELTILNFGLFWWRKSKAGQASAKRFSVYKESGYAAFFGVLLTVCFIELVAFHLALMHYSNTAAIVLTVLSAYGTLFIIGDFSAIVKSPVTILDGRLLLRTGLRWRAVIDNTNIASVEKVKDSFQPGDGCFKGGVMKSSINILFTFKNPVTIERLYRKPIMVKQIVMCVDEADAFIDRLVCS